MKPSPAHVALFTIITMATAAIYVEWTPAAGRRSSFFRVDPTDEKDVAAAVDRIVALGAGDTTIIRIAGRDVYQTNRGWTFDTPG